MNARGEISWTSLDEYESIANQQNEVFKHCSKEKALKILKRVKRNKAKLKIAKKSKKQNRSK